MNDKYLICLLAIAVATLLIVVISETETIIRLREKLKQLQKDHNEDNV
jgi:uncharacterized integral membrane protein